MTQIINFVEAEKTLAEYIPLAHEIIGKDISLERMNPLMTALGNPERKLKVVHIAGTSGKTSTAYYIAGLLQASGKKVGLSVSPHIDSVTERVQINLTPLNEEEFCKNLSVFLNLLHETGILPTYYELLMAFAYWYFEKIGVDYAVIETGLGGLHDGSNVAIRADKVCIITDIGFDHMHVLGYSLPEISLQKAGIIHAHNEVFMYQQPSEITEVFRKWCVDKQATLHELKQAPIAKLFKIDLLSELPLFKQRNWLLAYAVYEFIKRRDNLNDLSEDDLKISLMTYVPGRMDEVSVGGKKIIMDGAHNSQKMEAFVGSFQEKYPNTKATVLIAMKKGKEHESVINALQPIVRAMIATDFYVGQDHISSSVDPKVLSAEAQKAAIAACEVESNQLKAFDRALAMTSPGGTLIITGSLYLLSQLRQKHVELRHGRS